MGEEHRRQYILERSDGSGYVSLNRRYFPPEVLCHEDPLDADRFFSRENALRAIGGVHKERREDYRARKLKVEVI